MLLNEDSAVLFPVFRAKTLPYDHVWIDRRFETVFRIINIGHAAGHTGPEIIADRAENNDRPAGHIFTAIRAAAFDNGPCA